MNNQKLAHMSVTDWVEMFEQINTDCKQSGETVVPFNLAADTIEYYDQQIWCMFGGTEEEISEADSLKLATQICELGQTRNTKI